MCKSGRVQTAEKMRKNQNDNLIWNCIGVSFDLLRRYGVERKCSNVQEVANKETRQ